MASKKTITTENLEKLGATRLAQLLIEVTKGSPALKRIVKLALSESDPAETVKLVRKRLKDIGRSRSYVEGANRKALMSELETLRQVIQEKLTPISPSNAFELMWAFIGLAPSIYERCDDSSGYIGDIFAEGREDLSQIASLSSLEPEYLADKIYAALNDNGYGQYDGLIGLLSESLGETGLERLKTLFTDQAKASPGRTVSNWKRSTARYALQDIADALGDADSYAAQYDESVKTRPRIAARIAARFLTAGRSVDALAALDIADIEGNVHHLGDWETVRVNTFEALGRTDDAQTARWSAFERNLNLDMLQAHLKRLPDFEDIEFEDRAIAYAHAYENVHAALRFLVLWPRLDSAAHLIEARYDEIDGNYYELLTPATDVLENRHPLAATLLCRAMIKFTLERARAKRYRYAAGHLVTCERLASQIADFGQFQEHADYISALRENHNRKTSFWPLIP